MTLPTSLRHTCQREQRGRRYLRGTSSARVTCLVFFFCGAFFATLLQQVQGFVRPSTLIPSKAAAAAAAAATSPVTRASTISPMPAESYYQPEECAAQQADQDFRGIFPPIQRPLRFRALESEPARGLWLFEQPLHTIPTVRMYSRMAVYALDDGSVIAYNPIAPTEETLREIRDNFGTPDHIIVPTTAYNNMVFVKGWAERFPRATFWGLEGVKLPGAKFTKALTMKSFPESWKGELDLSILEGNNMFRECFLLHRTTRSVFAMDSFVEMGEDNIPHPLLRAGSKMTGNFGRPVCPTKSLLWNREQCKEAISKVLEWDFDTVYATHGECPIQDAKSAIRREFNYLWN